MNRVSARGGPIAAHDAQGRIGNCSEILTTLFRGAAEVQDLGLQHYCRGCGEELPAGFDGHFHRQCLRRDKRARIHEQRQRELQKFERWLAKQVCPACRTQYGMAKENLGTPCEASQSGLQAKSETE